MKQAEQDFQNRDSLWDTWYKTGQTKEMYERIARAYASQGTEIETYEAAMLPNESKVQYTNYPVEQVDPTKH